MTPTQYRAATKGREKMKTNWNTEMDKAYLVDDLNDFLREYGGKEISENTAMTVMEIKLITRTFTEMKKALRK